MADRLKFIRLTPVVRTGFGLILAAMAFVGGFSLMTINALIEANKWVTHTWEIKEQLRYVEKLLLDAETGQRGYLYTNSEAFLQPYLNARETLDDTVRELERLIGDTPVQQARVEQLEQLIEAKMNELAETIRLKQAGQEESLRSLVLSGEGQAVMNDIRALMNEMQDTEVELLAERSQRADNATTVATLTILGSTLAAMALGAIVLIFIARQVVRPINQVSNIIASSASEIAATVEQQERNAVNQASAIHQTTTTMEELEASSQQSAEQAEAASGGSQNILALASGSQNGVKTDRTSLRDKVGQIADRILHLSEQTGQIGNISSLVSDLANQTNMLALNAAVEAARAGENGKGFAVVASEIRKLADRSRHSAEQISTRVVEIRNATNSTVLVTDEGTKTVEEIVVAINDITLNSHQISLTAQQQAVAVQQVVEAMNTLNNAAQENASGISQIKLGIQQLHEAAINLKSII